MKAQLALFSPEDDALRSLHEAHAALALEQDSLRVHKLEVYWREKAMDYLHELYHGPCRCPNDTSRPLKPILTKLLTLCHPDKWSAGQLATDLAHELSTAINALRAHEGRPA